MNKPLNEKGMTLQTVILSGVLALASVGFGMVLWGVFVEQAEQQPGSIGPFGSDSALSDIVF